MFTKVQEYFSGLTLLQVEQFNALYSIYSSWNDKINVISRKDMDNFDERHVIHSLGIAKAIQFLPGTQIMDIGTGGGFPGIPLAIMFPDSDFLLVDSIGKKIKVVEAVCNDLNIKNVEAKQARAETINKSFHFIVSRAVTALPEFMIWTRNKISKQSFNSLNNGILYLKGGDFEDELKNLKSQSKIYHLSEFFNAPFFETKKLVHIY